MRWRTDPFTPPNHSGSLVLGNGWKLPNGGRLGAVGSFGYGHSYERREGVAREFVHAESDPRGFEEEIDYRVNEGEESVRWGAFGSIAYAPSDHDEIRLVGFRSQLANDLTRIFSGHSRELDSQVSGLRLQYVSRALNVGKLTGTHTFSALNGAVLDWSGLVSLAQRDEPDTRDAAFTVPGARFDHQLNVDSDSGRHFFSDLSEKGFGGTLDWTQPLDAEKRAELKLGGLGSVRRRDFQGRRFNFYPRPGQFFGCDGASFGPRCPDRTFSPSALSEGNLFFEERTFRSDGYTADLDVFAGYVMADLEVLRDLRLILGERVEATHQTIEPREFGTGEADGARLNGVDLLPSASVVYAISEKTKARAGASRTLARPQLRELAPFAFNDYYMGRVTNGNPDLKLTRITNLDLRLEYFPTLREVAALSVFYKQFTDPIEPTLLPGGGGGLQVSYVNTPGANLIGVELETRKGLGFISASLEDLSTVANLTLARSRIEVEQTGTNTITSLERPLVYQSPWVVNLALDYDNEDTGTRARISYNVNGPHIVEAGAYQVPDSYRQPQHYVDITASQTLMKGLDIKAGVEDILNSKTLVTQGKRAERGNVRTEFRDGAVIFVGASYTY